MNLKREATEIIRTLVRNRFRAECPCCREPIELSKGSLFFLQDFGEAAQDVHDLRLQAISDRKTGLRELKRKLGSVAEKLAASVNIGCVLERLAPSMPSFPFNRNDCRSLFEPIDYVIFHGLAARGMVERIIFADVKTGNAKLSLRQKNIRTLIENGKVEWSTYSPEESP
jgi:predicted Holliday junction resolvase-like endonuclease